MPRYSVRPDELTVAGALSDGDVGTLEAVASAVLTAGAAGGTVAASAADASGVVAGALETYTGVDAVVAAALGEAVGLLGRALADAATSYAAAEESVTAGWGP